MNKTADKTADKTARQALADGDRDFVEFFCKDTGSVCRVYADGHCDIDGVRSNQKASWRTSGNAVYQVIAGKTTSYSLPTSTAVTKKDKTGTTLHVYTTFTDLDEYKTKNAYAMRAERARQADKKAFVQDIQEKIDKLKAERKQALSFWTGIHSLNEADYEKHLQDKLTDHNRQAVIAQKAKDSDKQALAGEVLDLQAKIAMLEKLLADKGATDGADK